MCSFAIFLVKQGKLNRFVLLFQEEEELSANILEASVLLRDWDDLFALSDVEHMLRARVSDWLEHKERELLPSEQDEEE